MPLAAKTSARRGPMPFTYCTGVDGSSILSDVSRTNASRSGGKLGQHPNEKNDEEFIRRARGRARRQRDLLLAHATSPRGRAAPAFQGRLGPAGGFRDLRCDLCRGEVRAAGRSVTVVNSSHHVFGYVCGNPMLKPREPIASLSPYHSPILSRAGLSLDLNESMAGCSPRVLARLRSLSAADVSLYP